MSRTPTDYSKTVIYQIQHNHYPELVYVGHTTNLKNRQYFHKRLSLTSNALLYQMIRANGGFEMFLMSQVKEYACQSKAEACQEEERMMLELNATMNNVRASTFSNLLSIVFTV